MLGEGMMVGGIGDVVHARTRFTEAGRRQDVGIACREIKGKLMQ